MFAERIRNVCSPLPLLDWLCRTSSHGRLPTKNITASIVNGFVQFRRHTRLYSDSSVAPAKAASASRTCASVSSRSTPRAGGIESLVATTPFWARGVATAALATFEIWHQRCELGIVGIHLFARASEQRVGSHNITGFLACDHPASCWHHPHNFLPCVQHPQLEHVALLLSRTRDCGLHHHRD